MVVPDVAVVGPGHLTQQDLGVGPTGLALVVEVTSASARRRDLTTKRGLYEEWEVPDVVGDRTGAPFSLAASGRPYPGGSRWTLCGSADAAYLQGSTCRTDTPQASGGT